MGGILSGHTEFEHACIMIDPKENTRVRPTDNMDQRYVERWADVDFSIEHDCTLQAFALKIVRGFNHDSLDGYDPELAYRDPKKKKERVIGQYTPLGNLISNSKIVFVCYLFKKTATKDERKEIRKMVRQNSQQDLASMDRRGSSEAHLPRTGSDPSIKQTPPKPANYAKRRLSGSLSEH